MGNQKDARLNRLKFEIIDYVERHPGCTANQIVAGLAIDRGLNNHGLTPRKVGFLIPRELKDEICFAVDSVSGKRIYMPKSMEGAPRLTSEKKIEYAGAFFEDRKWVNDPKLYASASEIAAYINKWYNLAYKQYYGNGVKEKKVSVIKLGNILKSNEDFVTICDDNRNMFFALKEDKEWVENTFLTRDKKIAYAKECISNKGASEARDIANYILARHSDETGVSKDRINFLSAGLGAILARSGQFDVIDGWRKRYALPGTYKEEKVTKNLEKIAEGEFSPEELRLRRKSLGMTQAEVAKEIGYKGNGTISHFENGLSIPNPADTRARAYLELLGYDVKVAEGEKPKEAPKEPKRKIGRPRKSQGTVKSDYYLEIDAGPKMVSIGDELGGVILGYVIEKPGCTLEEMQGYLETDIGLDKLTEDQIISSVLLTQAILQTTSDPVRFHPLSSRTKKFKLVNVDKKTLDLLLSKYT